MQKESIIELAKRRGFFWQSYELYGAVGGFFDYGPLGATVKRRVEELWRQFYIREGFYEIETPTVAPEEVFIASGHAGHFSDAMVECKACGAVFRADHIIEGVLKESGSVPTPTSIDEINKLVREKCIKCTECKGELTDAVPTSLMMRTSIGAKGRTGYIRPETAQGAYINFKRLLKFYREKLPFGVIQIGRAYRNEISPRQGVVRLREFNMAELELFVHPDEKKKHPRFKEVKNVSASFLPAEGGGVDPLGVPQPHQETKMTFGDAMAKKIIIHEYLAYHIAKAYLFLREVGIPEERLRLRQHHKDERAHYALDCWDCEVQTEQYGWIEVVGIADRGDYDLKSHETYSKEPMGVFVPIDKPKVEVRVLVVPDMGILGPRLKDKVSKVVEALNSRWKDKTKTVAKEKASEAVEALKERIAREGDKEIRLKIDNELVVIEKGVVKLQVAEKDIMGENVIPHVIEPSFGIDRLLYCIIELAHHEEKVEGEEETRTVLKFQPKIAPVQVAVLPLQTDDELVEKARKIEKNLRKELMVEYDDSGSIGRRYRRQDEIGTPFCVTVDFDTLKDKTVTIRDRDTMKQVRVGAGSLRMKLRESFR